MNTSPGSPNIETPERDPDEPDAPAEIKKKKRDKITLPDAVEDDLIEWVKQTPCTEVEESTLA